MSELRLHPLKKINSVYLMGIFIFCCFGSIATESSSPKAVPPHIVSNIDTFVQSVSTCSDHETLSLSVVKDGQVVISKGYGHTSVKNSNKVTSKTKFAIGSLTKAFTALLLAKVVDESDSITFDTPISKFIPNFRLVDDYRSKYASLRDLLGHRMALPRFDTPLIMGIDPKISRKDFARKLQFLHSPYSFREKFIYNNNMYILAGDILEQLSEGRSWESLVSDTIFKPLGMSDSGFVVDEKAYNDDFALPRSYVNGTIVDIDPHSFQIGSVVGPAGTIFSTADDMAKWMKFLLSKNQSSLNIPGLDITPSMVKATMQPSFEMPDTEDLHLPEFPVSEQSNYYCMGWVSGSYRGYKKIFHTGGIITHSSRVWLYPDMNLGIYLAINGPEKGRKDSLSAVSYYISDVLLNLPTWFNVSDACSSNSMPWERNDDDLDNDNAAAKNETEFNCTDDSECNLLDYVGTYTDPTFGDTVVSINSGSNNSSEDSTSPRLTFKFGRFGLLDLTQRSRWVFTGKFYGPFLFLNRLSDVFEVEFSIKDDNNDNGNEKGVKSLSMSLFGESKAGPFHRQDITEKGNNSHNANVVSYSLLLIVIFASGSRYFLPEF